MDSFLSHVLTFVGGALAKWFQGALQDHKKERHATRDEIYRPAREQIHNSIPEVQSKTRVTKLDFQFWQRIVASGRDRDVPENLRINLQELFNREMPRHDRAWQSGYNAVIEVMELTDRNFGTGLTGRDIPVPDWWKFLTNETFDPALVPWNPNEPARIWNSELNPTSLRPLNGGRQELLRRIWSEAQDRQNIRDYKEIQASCLSSAKRCLLLLDAAIGGALHARLSKLLGKLTI